MKIKTNEFCYLSSVPAFQSWLYAMDAELHASLKDHLRQGKGCASNRAKMIAILNKLLENPDSSRKLQTFLMAQFPNLIEHAPVRESPSLQNCHNVFEHYDPTLNTIPRRKIITKLEAATVGVDLDVLVTDFCSKQAMYKKVMVDDRVYIEYLPPELDYLKDEIPEKNWQIPRYNSVN